MSRFAILIVAGLTACHPRDAATAADTAVKAADYKTRAAKCRTDAQTCEEAISCRQRLAEEYHRKFEGSCDGAPEEDTEVKP